MEIFDVDEEGKVKLYLQQQQEDNYGYGGSTLTITKVYRLDFTTMLMEDISGDPNVYKLLKEVYEQLNSRSAKIAFWKYIREFKPAHLKRKPYRRSNKL